MNIYIRKCMQLLAKSTFLTANFKRTVPKNFACSFIMIVCKIFLFASAPLFTAMALRFMN
jgi:hypothetical protein